MTTGRMCMLYNFSGIEIATGRIVLYFWDNVNIATERVYWDSHWAYEIFNFRDCIDVATGRL